MYNVYVTPICLNINEMNNSNDTGDGKEKIALFFTT